MFIAGTMGNHLRNSRLAQGRREQARFPADSIDFTLPPSLMSDMRFVLKQKFWSWGDDFRIQDADGKDVYFVDGKAFSWGDKLSFQDMQGRELAFIRQKLLSWGPTYEIEVHGRLTAIVKKKLFTLLRCKFTVDVPGPDDLEAQGSFLDREYTIARQGRQVAEISKRWFTWTDTYGIEVAEGEDPVLLLATAVVIDMVCHQESKNGSS